MMLLLSLVVGELQDKTSQLGMFSEFTMTHVEPLAKYVTPLIQIVHILAVSISQQCDYSQTIHIHLYCHMNSHHIS